MRNTNNIMILTFLLVSNCTSHPMFVRNLDLMTSSRARAEERFENWVRARTYEAPSRSNEAELQRLREDFAESEKELAAYLRSEFNSALKRGHKHHAAGLALMYRKVADPRPMSIENALASGVDEPTRYLAAYVLGNVPIVRAAFPSGKVYLDLGMGTEAHFLSGDEGRLMTLVAEHGGAVIELTFLPVQQIGVISTGSPANPAEIAAAEKKVKDLRSRAPCRGGRYEARAYSDTRSKQQYDQAGNKWLVTRTTQTTDLVKIDAECGLSPKDQAELDIVNSKLYYMRHAGIIDRRDERVSQVLVTMPTGKPASVRFEQWERLTTDETLILHDFLSSQTSVFSIRDRAGDHFHRIVQGLAGSKRLSDSALNDDIHADTIWQRHALRQGPLLWRNGDYQKMSRKVRYGLHPQFNPELNF